MEHYYRVSIFLSISETISLEIRQKKETSSEDEGQQESGYLAGC